MHDLVIRGGTIVDGTGRPGEVGDLALSDGRIASVGGRAEQGRREIDAGGRVVAPGFIDIHTHYDAQVLWDRMLTVSPWHGVTSVVMGNCGLGLAPTRESDREFMLRTLQHVEDIPFEATAEGLGDWGFETYPQYLDLLERRGVGINVAVLVGHNAVRTWVLGQDSNRRRELEPGELAAMRAIVREALEVGAPGFSSTDTPAHFGEGGIPVPSRWTTPEEFEALVSVLHEVGRGTLQCSEGSDVTIPHLARMLVDWGIRLCDPGIIVRPDHSERVRLDVMDPLTKSGYEWYPQIGVLPTTFEVGLENPFMFAVDLASVAMRATPLDELFGPLIDLRDNTARIAVYRDPEFRRRFAAETDTDVWNRNYWPWVTVSLAPSAPQLEGRSLVDVAAERAMSPAEVMLDLSIDSDLEARFAVVAGNQDEDVVMDYFHNDTIRLGKSDAGAHVSQLCDARYPTNLLGRWVREKGLAMERAVRMLTSMEAECYGIFERGALVEGWHADVTVFDPETVIDGPVRRVRDLPAGMPRLVAHAVGIEHVIVNGIPLREGDRDVVDAVDGPLPGQVLRHYHGHRERVLGPVVASR